MLELDNEAARDVMDDFPIAAFLMLVCLVFSPLFSSLAFRLGHRLSSRSRETDG